MSIYRRNECRLCASRSLKCVLSLTPTPLGDAYVEGPEVAAALPVYPIDLFLCEDCGYTCLLDVVTPDEIYPDYIYHTAMSPGLQAHFASYADDVLRKVERVEPGLAVDLGSNDGTLLREFKEKGWRVLGVDPAVDIAALATQSGINTLGEYFSEEVGAQIADEFGRADVVTVNNCLANIDDLHGFVAGVGKILAHDGVFIVEFAYLVDLIEGMIFDYVYHEHLSYFTVSSLSRFMAKFGMVPFDLTHTNSKGGSVRVFFQNARSARSIRPIVAEFTERETKLRLSHASTYGPFRAKIEHENAKCRRVVESWIKQGRIVVGYGASVTCTTLLYHFGLEKLLSFLVDDNPAKQRRFAPGSGLEVLPSARLHEAHNIAIVVLAWRFVDPIITTIGEIAGSGDLPIYVPLPEGRLLTGPALRDRPESFENDTTK